MADRHPQAGRRTDSPLVMAEVEHMPILDRTKPFVAMNESTVCTVETSDKAGAKRGAVALGLSRHDLGHGFVVYQTIEEAEAIVVILGNAIADAKRIEAGEQPLAPAGRQPPVKH
jgi:hypothetical protein